MRRFLNLYPIKLLVNFNSWEDFMNEDKKWMLMTYYCPTHGDAGKVEPIQVTRQEISNNLYDMTKSNKEI